MKVAERTTGMRPLDSSRPSKPLNPSSKVVRTGRADVLLGRLDEDRQAAPNVWGTDSQK